MDATYYMKYLDKAQKNS